MDEKTALKKFYEQCGEKYPEEEIVYQTLRGRLRKRFVLKYLKSFKGSLLEIGTNRGMYLQNYDNGPRFGIDLSFSVLKQAHREKPVNLAVSDAEKLCISKNSIDHVLCSEVLEHCLNPQEIFNGIATVLKPGGVALLTTPNFNRTRPTYMAVGSLTTYDVDCEYGDSYFHTAYKPYELVEMAEKEGLKALKVGTLEKEVKYATKLPVILLLSCRILNKYIKSEAFAIWNESFFHRFTNFIYNVTHFLYLDRLLVMIIPNGVRSFIVMQKPK